MIQKTPEKVIDHTLHLPRILCLHGGGTNARIFRMQCRAVSAQLKSEFRLVFAEAPYDSQAGPDVLSVYSQCGPFKRWLRWRPEHPDVRLEDTVWEIDQSLDDAMRDDDRKGATGEWVGLLGFSQGAKVAASLLYRQQVRAETYGHYMADSNWRFGVLMAGRAPLVDLDPDIALEPPLPDATQITDLKGWAGMKMHNNGHVLRIPTIHVHGSRDPGIELHRELYDEYCEAGTKTLIEWDGNHRIPLKANDVAKVTCRIRELAREMQYY